MSAIPSSSGATLNIFGHTLDAIHRARREAEMRIWLLLRHIDRAGEGRVHRDVIRERLTVSDLRCLSWRRCRQILHAGRGLFWQAGKDGFIYYRSEARVLDALNVRQVRGFAVTINVKETLLGSIQDVRALCHNGFHSARVRPISGWLAPITRRAQRERGGRDKRTQRSYERIAGIVANAQYAVIQQYTPAAWQQHKNMPAEFVKAGGPAFSFVDFDGRLGRNVAKPESRPWHNIYIVRQVANLYYGSLDHAIRSKWHLNAKLDSLIHSRKSTWGNSVEVAAVSDEEQIETQSQECWQDTENAYSNKCWHADEKIAVKYIDRQKTDLAYSSTKSDLFWQEHIPFLI